MAGLGAGAQKYLRWTVFGLSLVSFIFVIVAVGHCSFIEGVGLFNFEVSGDRCLRYDSDTNFDSAFKAGRAFGAMAAVFVSFNTFFVVCMLTCVNLQDEKKRNMAWMVIRILFIISFVCQLLMFSAYDICDGSCDVGAAGVVAILNVFILLALIVLSWLVSPPQHPLLMVKLYERSQTRTQPPASTSQAASDDPVEVEYPEKGDTTKITVVDGPNGERITTKEITHSDGSKTITETVEQMG